MSSYLLPSIQGPEWDFHPVSTADDISWTGVKYFSIVNNTDSIVLSVQKIPGLVTSFEYITKSLEGPNSVTFLPLSVSSCAIKEAVFSYLREISGGE